MNRCPLCHGGENTFYAQDKTGEYRQCSACFLVFVLPSSHLDEVSEKERYDLHTNSPDDPHYRKFLSKVLEPVCARIPAGSSGLDFGSGPGPTLSLMFEEKGHSMNIYDHFYARDETVLKKKYDFITSTEVLEHLFDPASVIEKLFGMLKPSGLLAVLTQPYPLQEEFISWYYKNDPTHVCFFSVQTMEWIAQRFDAELEVLGKDVFIFKKVGS